MGAACVQAPIDHTDTHTAYRNTHPSQPRSTLRLAKHLVKDNTHSINTTFHVNQLDNVNWSNLNSSDSAFIHSYESKELAQPKSKKTKNQIPSNRRRKSIRHISFDTSHECKLNLFPSESSNKSSINYSYEYIDYDMPYLPIRFTNNYDIWNKEFILFTNTLSDIVYSSQLGTNIIKTILEFAQLDSIYKSHHNSPCNRGLWPQEYILNKTKINTNINENSVIINTIRDELIHSFNLHYIFEICGNCFQYKTNNKMDNFFISGLYKDKDLYTNNICNNMLSEYEINDGFDTSTASIAPSINTYTNNNINPLKFKIYSHDIMICPNGFCIERHNEYYEQSEDKINSDNENSELLYYFTLLLLPPNIDTYKGGKYKFYNVENNIKYLNDSRNCTPIPLNANNNTDEYIEIKAHKYYWTWILFDKRVEYTCDPIINGSAITFKMDIDIWRKSVKEIKQNEQSYERINKLLNGQLNINMKHNNNNENNYDSDLIDLELSQSPNIVFPPYAIKWENL